MSEKVFSDQDKKQLCKMLKLSSDDLDRTIEACKYIFQKAAYFRLKATDLTKELVTTLNMDKEQSNTFGQIWAKMSTKVTETLSKHTLGGPLMLSGTDWRVALQVGQQTKSHMHEPRAIFQLSLSDTVGGDACEHSTMEFSSNELSSFFKQIELVQKQLDKLGVQ